MQTEDWYQEAACKGKPLSVFFPDPVDYSSARTICKLCSVSTNCLATALLEEGTVSLGMFWFHGYRGGMTPNERRTLLLKIRQNGTPPDKS